MFGRNRFYRRNINDLSSLGKVAHCIFQAKTAGTANYTTTFYMESLNSRATYEIDLGDVKNIAEVILNGKNMGSVWKTAFKLDIKEPIQKGENQLEIRVTNTWVNRLVGDAQPGVKNKTTFTSMPLIRPNTPLTPSGIIGEVKIITMQ